MKRLKKKADNSASVLIEAIRSVCGSNEFGDLIALLPTIQDQYPDAIYSGHIYRKMIIPFETLETMNHYQKGNQEYISKEEFIEEIRNFVTVGEWQSCTYSLDSCKNFYPLEVGISFIISFEGEGIDLQQLCEELTYDNDEDIATQAEVLQRAYENEDEVVAQVPSTYKVVTINNENISKLKSKIKIEFFDQQFEESQF